MKLPYCITSSFYLLLFAVAPGCLEMSGFSSRPDPLASLQNASNYFQTAEDTQLKERVEMINSTTGEIKYQIATQPKFGKILTFNEGTGDFEYMPNANANGVEKFEVTVTVNGVAQVPNTRVTIEVSPINDAPTAKDTALTAVEDTLMAPVNISSQVASDIDSTSFKITIAKNGTKGTATISADGILSYQPSANQNGSDVIELSVSDGQLSAPVTAKVTVNINPVNDTPVAQDMTINASKDEVNQITVLGADADGDSLFYSITSQPTNGTLQVNTTSLIVSYKPNAGFVGADKFQFAVSDGKITSTPKTVTIAVKDPDDTLTFSISEGIGNSLDKSTVDFQISSNKASKSPIYISYQCIPLVPAVNDSVKLCGSSAFLGVGSTKVSAIIGVNTFPTTKSTFKVKITKVQSYNSIAKTFTDRTAQIIKAEGMGEVKALVKLFKAKKITREGFNYGPMCALMFDGTVKCMAAYANGYDFPKTMPGLSGIKDIDGGNESSMFCAINALNNVICWGEQVIGDAVGGGWVFTNAMRQISGVDNVRAIRVHAKQACAITFAHELKCWGYVHPPGGVGGISTPTAITLPGFNQAVLDFSFIYGTYCAITLDTKINCWGLGPINTEMPSNPSPWVNMTSVVVGNVSTCGINTSGIVKCWGRGSLGDGIDRPTSNPSSPVTVLGINNAVQLDWGYNFSYAVGSDGSLKCWGQNCYGYSNILLSPAVIPTPVGAKSIAGECLIGVDDVVRCIKPNGRGYYDYNGLSSTDIFKVAYDTL